MIRNNHTSWDAGRQDHVLVQVMCDSLTLVSGGIEVYKTRQVQRYLAIGLIRYRRCRPEIAGPLGLSSEAMPNGPSCG